MPSQSDLVLVSRQLKTRLNGQAFLTLPRREITDIVRDVSGEDQTRIKSQMAEDLERQLLNQGVRCFPSLQGTSGSDMIRLFHTTTVVGSLVDMLQYPSEQTDQELAAAISKIKGTYAWGRDAERPDAHAAANDN